MSRGRLTVVGLGVGEPMPDRGQLLARLGGEAAVLVGGRRHLDRLGRDWDGVETLATQGGLSPLLERIEERLAAGMDVAVLASGDPLFFGIGARLAERFGARGVRFVPAVTTLAAAAARLGLPWQDIPVVSLHGRADFSPLFSRLAGHRLVGVYTDPAVTPARVAAELLSRGVSPTPGECVLHVLEDLGGAMERVRALEPGEAARLDFQEPNFVLVELLRPAEVALSPGIPDDLLVHEASLITKLPVRAVALSLLRLAPESVLWDLGAGSGAVAVEASRLAGRVLAVERKPERAAMIRANIRRTHAFGVEVVVGDMPDCLGSLPEPDRIFVGGGLSGGQEVLLEACARLTPGGRLVVAAILLGSLELARRVLARQGFDHSVLSLQAAQSRPLAGDLRLEPMNPVYLVSADKPRA